VSNDVDAKLRHALSLHQRGQLSEAQALYQEILQSQPRHPRALHWVGLIALQSNRPQEAVEWISRSLAVDPGDALAHEHLGTAWLELKNLAASAACYDRSIELKPDRADAHYNRANLYMDCQRYEDAVAGFDRAIACQPRHLPAILNRGLALLQLQRPEAAVASFEAAIALDANHAPAHHHLGNALLAAGRPEAAIASYDRAIALLPGFAEVHNARGNALAASKRFTEARLSFERAIALDPGFAAAHVNRGNLFGELRQWDQAIESYDRAIALDDGLAIAHCNRAQARGELRQWSLALAGFERALELDPKLADAYYLRGKLRCEMQHYRLAVADFDQAIALRPDHADAYNNRGNALQDIPDYEAAVLSYQRALELKPTIPFVQGMYLYAKGQVCDWRNFEPLLEQLAAMIDDGLPAAPPFAVLALSGSPDLQRRAAQIWVGKECPAEPLPGPAVRGAARPRLKVGYFSADLREHPLAFLAAELFELHDRSRFEVTAFSFGHDTQDAMRRRLEVAFERFIDVRRETDTRIVELARELELDIAVDLNGFTGGGRPRIFAERAAPLQVSYLGYLGTLGAAYMDYLVADLNLVPPEDQPHYAEQMLYLPNYQVNDSKRRIADRVFSRAELGLPPDAFVYCCFNANFKLMPATFDGWMQILRRVPGSVLFLYAGGGAGSAAVERNLRLEAANRGVAAERLVFGKRLPAAEYLARYRVADLFLDTLPYNAGTTASDALWAGLPVLTCRGESFAGRVAASLLHAIELPELITHSPSQYIETAVALALDPGRLALIRQRLLQNRSTTPLFDTPRFTRHLEAGFIEIHERHAAGLPPAHVHVG
jgi:predicted O-linked N-acetylglucosamine transferase (SPINDLY family)